MQPKHLKRPTVASHSQVKQSNGKAKVHASMPELRQKNRDQQKVVYASKARLNPELSVTSMSNPKNDKQNLSCCDKLKQIFHITPDLIREFRNSIALEDDSTVGPQGGINPSVRVLEPLLTGAEDDVNLDKEAPIIVLTYSQTLHRSMRVLWIPISLMGRIPFKLEIERNRATIKLEMCSLTYVMCAFGVIVMWILLLWFSAGALLMLFQKDPNFNAEIGTTRTTVNTTTNLTSTELVTEVTRITEDDIRFLERRISIKYWIDLFIFWTTLFQATVSTTHLLIFGKSYAGFVREWYKVLDLSKTQISKSLMQYILVHWSLLLSLVLLMIILFAIPTSYPAMTMTCQMIMAVFFRPIVPRDFIKVNGKYYFETYAVFGLMVYIVAVVFTWLSIIMFLVFCRCFRNALKLMNQRIRMLINPTEEARLGPNAIRLDHVTVHKDYVAIAFTGLKAGTVFGHIMLSYFCWSILCLVFVMGVLVYYGAENPTHPKNVALLTAVFPGTDIRQRDPALAHVLNLCGHLILAATTVVIITMGPAECFREGRQTYELATYKGLFLAQTQLERNFIRSLWILASDKFPLAISARGYFKMTRGMLIAFLMCVFTYFIFLVQSRNQLDQLGTPNNDTDSDSATVTK